MKAKHKIRVSGSRVLTSKFQEYQRKRTENRDIYKEICEKMPQNLRTSIFKDLEVRSFHNWGQRQF